MLLPIERRLLSGSPLGRNCGGETPLPLPLASTVSQHHCCSVSQTPLDPLVSRNYTAPGSGETPLQLDESARDEQADEGGKASLQLPAKQLSDEAQGDTAATRGAFRRGHVRRGV